MSAGPRARGTERALGREATATATATTMTPPAIPVELPARGQRQFLSQRPYKYGMAMLCMGALVNWLGLAENYVEPVRFIGVACIITGAMLICAAMCCWMNSHNVYETQASQEAGNIHVIDIEEANAGALKPPDYDSVASSPPSYDVAIKLSPMLLLAELPAVHGSPPPPYAITVREGPPPEHANK